MIQALIFAGALVASVCTIVDACCGFRDAPGNHSGN